jgi:hypothetical protein
MAHIDETNCALLCYRAATHHRCYMTQGEVVQVGAVETAPLAQNNASMDLLEDCSHLCGTDCGTTVSAM